MSNASSDTKMLGWGRVRISTDKGVAWSSAKKHVGVGMVCLTPVVQGCCYRLLLGSLLSECSKFSSSC